MRILYLDLDALTPRHLGCYGYLRNTSPTIDAIASEGMRFENVYCSDAPCLPSRTAFYSGRFGIQTGVVGHGGTAADPKVEGPTRGFRDLYQSDGLAGQLQRAGLHTAMISPFGQRHAAWHFYAGFNEIHNTGGGGMEDASEVTPVVEKWLTDHASRRRLVPPRQLLGHPHALPRPRQITATRSRTNPSRTFYTKELIEGTAEADRAALRDGPQHVSR